MDETIYILIFISISGMIFCYFIGNILGWEKGFSEATKIHDKHNKEMKERYISYGKTLGRNEMYNELISEHKREKTSNLH